MTDSFAGVGECYMVSGASEFVVTGKKGSDIREGVKNIKVPRMAFSNRRRRNAPIKEGVILSPAANGRLSKVLCISPTRRIPTNASLLSKVHLQVRLDPKQKLYKHQMVSTFVVQNRKELSPPSIRSSEFARQSERSIPANG
ncbi:MAG: hypothetical protein ACLTQI_09680 [Slackia sp.]